MRYVLIIVAVLAIAVIALLGVKAAQVNREKASLDGELANTKYNALPALGSVKSLSILPLVDYFSDNKDLKTESGVSYLVRADGLTILMDVGENRKKEHPSPLLHNMKMLGVDTRKIDSIVITHIHPDHVGGMKEMRAKTFSLSQGLVDLSGITAYAPGPMTPSRWNPAVKIEVVTAPKVIAPGVASIGVIPRALYLMGRTDEQALMVNVKGKGLVIIVGCGHQTIERIVERVRMISGEPIYAVIGGLHFPVNGGRAMLGPINIQKLVGTDAPPWRGLKEKDVLSAVETLKKLDPALVALSPHDSSDWSLDKFRQAFGKKYVDVKVGKEIKI